MSYTDLNEAVEAYVDYCVDDYVSWNRAMGYEKDGSLFKSQFSWKKGKKYIKVIRESSVHAFIVAEDDSKFKAGDILKPAGWATPAKNKARGNVLEGKYSGGWTGPGYLR